MSTVKLCSVTGKQFLSFYEPFEFNLTQWEGKAVQIDGDNRDDEGAESNGAGKSALIELIGWTWYGELCRKLRYKNNVVHKLGKECSAIGTAVIDSVGYRVERKQNKKGSQELYVFSDTSGELWPGSTTAVKQQKLEELLGMNFLAFQCMVMFGHEFMSFPDLVPSERARVLTELRGLERYVQASKQCADGVKVLQGTMQNQKIQLISVEATIDQLRKTDYKPNITKYEENRKAEVKEIQLDIDTNDKALKAIVKGKKEQSDKVQTEIDSITKSIKANEKILTGSEGVRNKLDGFRKSIATSEASRGVLQKEFVSLQNEIKQCWKLGTGMCPTCKQPISKKVLEAEIKNMGRRADQSKIEADQLSTVIEDLRLEESKVIKDFHKLTEIQAANDNLRNDVSKLKVVLERVANSREETTCKTTLKNLKDRLEDIEKTVNPYKEMEETRKKDLFTHVATAKEIKSKIEALETEALYYGFWVEGFKKIRYNLFSTMIDELQDRAQEYLSKYSTVLQVSFDTQRETRSGTVKDEFHIIVTDQNGVDIPYEIYSSGQRQKVRLAVTRALAQMISEQCGKDFNVAAFDEPNDSLDDTGKETNMELFTELAREGKAVLVTDHDETFKERFDNSITVVLENDRSFIQY